MFLSYLPYIILSVFLYFFVEFLTPISPIKRLYVFLWLRKENRRTRNKSLLQIHSDAIHWEKGDKIVFVTEKNPWGNDFVDIGELKTFNKYNAIILTQQKPIVVPAGMIIQNETCTLKLELRKSNEYQRNVVQPALQDHYLITGEQYNDNQMLTNYEN